jgi:FixJ family two-component response regulator
MKMRQPLVAIVEDDLGARSALVTLLRAYGYRVEAYESAEEFLAAKRAEQPACLVLDVNLADISGIELSRHLLANGRKVPTIFVTGLKDERSRRQALELGCVAFIGKPYTAEVLIEAVATATGPDPFFER